MAVRSGKIVLKIENGENGEGMKKGSGVLPFLLNY
jgi:hypothetical protein